MTKTLVEITVTEAHIGAASQGGPYTPVELALIEQTEYQPGGFFNGALSLLDGHGGEMWCPLPADLRQFLAAFRQGLPVQPATFQLECEPLRQPNGQH
jgi:hypothetical protein